jgi:hypothetical protein
VAVVFVAVAVTLCPDEVARARTTLRLGDHRCGFTPGTPGRSG